MEERDYLVEEERDYSVELEKVFIKEWKRNVYVKPISFEEQLTWEKSFDKDNPGNSIATLVSFSTCDKNGKPLWDLVRIPKLPSKIITRLHVVCLRVSALRKKDLDDAIKNSEADQPD